MIEISEFPLIEGDALRDAREIEEACRAHDGLRTHLAFDSSLNIHREMKSWFLAHRDGRPAGFASIFAPGRDEAELSVYVHPDHRHRGCAKALVRRVFRELRHFGIPEVLFVCERGSCGWEWAVAEFGAAYEFTEYVLRYDAQEAPSARAASGIDVRRAKPSDTERLVELSIGTFGDNREVARNLIVNSFTSGREVFLASRGDLDIGTCSITDEEGGTFLYGLGILPAERGKGYGEALLADVIRRQLTAGRRRILLEVDSTNAGALRLYRKCGFLEETAIEYYRAAVPG